MLCSAACRALHEHRLRANGRDLSRPCRSGPAKFPPQILERSAAIFGAELSRLEFIDRLLDVCPRLAGAAGWRRANRWPAILRFDRKLLSRPESTRLVCRLL